MKAVLHITSSGPQLWRKTANGWEKHEGNLSCPVWVVSDLAEESFAEMQIPRIFGNDRVEYVKRQLVSRFPDTPYKATLPIKSSGGLMERVFPPRQTLIGVDAAQRVTAAIDAISAPIAGVWATSILLANIGARAALPQDLFVIFPGSESLRIVFVKDRVPVLSRLIPGAVEPKDQAAEVTRTLRHLENTRIINRGGGNHSVLFLGNTNGLEAQLAKDRMTLVAPPRPWANKASDEWRHVLFDLVLTSPPGQLAPMARRTAYIADRLRQPAYALAALSLGLAAWTSGQNLLAMAANQRSQQEVNTRVQQLTDELEQTEQKMARFGVSAELVRRAVALDKEEILTAPSLQEHMQQLGQAIGRLPSIRLEGLEWRVLQPGQIPCARDASAPSTEQQENEPQRVTEISLKIFLSKEFGEKARVQSLSDISSALAGLPGTTLLNDPAKGFDQAALRGGMADNATEQPLSWCMTLPTTQPSKP